MERKIDIGLILGAFGIKGEVRILSLNDEPGRFLDCESLDIFRDEVSVCTCKIEKVRIHQKHALVKFDCVPDRTEAEKLKGCYVRLPSGVIDELTPAEEARIEREKLIGLEVFTKSGDRLGVLEEVIRTGANDVYEVNDGVRSVLLPAIGDVILEVDLETGRMVVDPLPGLL